MSELQGAVLRLSRDINELQKQLDASYSGSFMCYRTIVSAAKASEAAFCVFLSPLIDHSEKLMRACDDASLQLQVVGP